MESEILQKKAQVIEKHLQHYNEILNSFVNALNQFLAEKFKWDIEAEISVEYNPDGYAGLNCIRLKEKEDAKNLPCCFVGAEEALEPELKKIFQTKLLYFAIPSGIGHGALCSKHAPFPLERKPHKRRIRA